MNERGFSLVELIIATTLFAFLMAGVGRMEADFYMHQAQSIVAEQRYAGIVALRNAFENKLNAITYVASPAKTGSSASMVYGYTNTVWNNTASVYNSNTGQQTIAVCVSNTCPSGVTGPYCAYFYATSGVATPSSACSYTSGWTFLTGGITTLTVFSRDNTGAQEVLRLNASFNLGYNSTGTISSAIQITTGS